MVLVFALASLGMLQHTFTSHPNPTLYSGWMDENNINATVDSSDDHDHEHRTNDPVIRVIIVIEL